jgi:hypothetical protein
LFPGRGIFSKNFSGYAERGPDRTPGVNTLSAAAIQNLHLMEYKVDDCLVSDYGVDHQVVELTRRPVLAIVAFYEGRTVPVYVL